MTWILIAALLPAALLFHYIYRRDPVKEPTRELVKGFFFGVLAAPASLLVSVPLTYLGLVPVAAETFWQHVSVAFLGAAIPEEIAKYVMLFLLLRKSAYFDEHFDGIVYSVCVGLGFAAFENIQYLFANVTMWLSVGIQRALFAVPAHFFFALIMGYFVSRAKFGLQEDRKKNLILALVLPIAAHGIFDAILMVSSINPVVSFVGTIIFLIFFVRLAKFSTNKIGDLIAQDIAENNGAPDDQGYSA
jgi:RsiW-degrading membrane proteinase PrsW (M82 family)